jgi:hypothetical protein
MQWLEYEQKRPKCGKPRANFPPSFEALLYCQVSIEYAPDAGASIEAPPMTSSKRLIAVVMLAGGVLGFLIGASTSEAQDQAIAPLPQSINGALQQAGIPLPPPAEDPSSIESVERPESPFQYQPFDLMPHFLYLLLYEYGVLAKQGRPATTLIDSFAPGFGLQVGTHWNLDYTATWDVYSNHVFKDTLGHSATLIGQDTFGDWTALFTQSYNYSSTPLVETGEQTTVQEYRTSLDASRELARNVLSETILNQDLRLAQTFTDTYQWSIDQWLHYRFSSQFDTAVGGEAGYVHESQGSDSNYTEPEAQATWQPTQKLRFSVSGGLEHRVFLDYPRTSLDTPTYDFSAQYSPFEQTKVTLDVVRLVSPSLFANESTRTARENLSVSQRLLGEYFVVGGIGNSDIDYLMDGQSLGIVRSDTQITYNLKVSRAFLRRGTASLFTFRSRNSSSIPGYNFATTQFGVELGYKY